MSVNPELPGALRRAADWLEQNPDRHITGQVAATKKGEQTGVGNKKADCFCAIGRVGRELGLRGEQACYDVFDNQQIREAVIAVEPKKCRAALYVINDAPWTGREDRTVCELPRGNPEVVPIMRALADRLECQ